MSSRRRLQAIGIFILISFTTALSWFQAFTAVGPLLPDRNLIEVGGSPLIWLNRQACRWLGVCELYGSRYKLSNEVLGETGLHGNPVADTPIDAGIEESSGLGDRTNRSWSASEIPDYVLEHAPLVHLYSKEKFWPCDVAEHLLHVTPNLNYTPMQFQYRSLNLTNLDDLNEWDDGRFVFLTSNDNVEDRPDWLSGHMNIPDKYEEYNELSNTDDDGQEISNAQDDELPRLVKKKSGGMSHPKLSIAQEDRNKHNARWRAHQQWKKVRPGPSAIDTLVNMQHQSKLLRRPKQGGRSDAPAVLIVVDKGNGVVDAFWFFFYSYNLGNVVFNIRFGNHVGDWEHTLVRFEHGKPKYVYFSEHNFGSAYGYGAVEKIGKRPVAYSATGTHAMYATPGAHPYVLPFGILHDQTDRGPLWDPLLNSHTYTYSPHKDDLRASNVTPRAPVEWFYYAGHWGDKYYPLNDERQYEFAGQYHYVTGPLGPRFKNLNRRKVCQGRYTDPCVIKNWLIPAPVKYWDGMGNGENRSEDF